MLDNTTITPASLPQQAVAQPRSAPTPSGCRQTSWHVAATKPRAEHIALAALHHRGYAPYLPLTLGKPLFPGYVFLQLGNQQPWYPIAWAPGVFNLLATAGKPNVVARGVIEALQAGDEARATPIPKSASWAPGMPCRPRKGHALEGMDAVVIRNIPKSPYVHIAIMMLGHLREVAIPPKYLELRTIT